MIEAQTLHSRVEELEQENAELRKLLGKLENVHMWRDEDVLVLCACCGAHKTVEQGIFPSPVHKEDCELKAVIEAGDV